MGLGKAHANSIAGWLQNQPSNAMHLLGPTLHSIQFTAIFGDLHHKYDVYTLRQNYYPSTTCLFSNNEQASYLLSTAQALIPPGNWNNHSLGTWFEFFYESNTTFRLQYLGALPSLYCNE